VTTLDREVTRKIKTLTGSSTPPQNNDRAKAAARIAWRITKWLARNGWRHRVALSPLYAITLAYTLAVTEYLLEGAGSVSVAAGAVAGLVIYRWRGFPTPAKLHGVEPREQGITIGAWTALGIITGLSVITANFGTGLPIPGIWAILTVAALATWWTVIATAPADTAAMTSERAQTTWTKRVASQKGPIPGSVLGKVTRVDGKSLAPAGHLGPVVARMGWTAVAELDAVGTSAKTVLSADNAAKIAAAYKTSTINVVLSRDDDQSEHKIRVTVMAENATSDINTYAPETWQVSKDGCVPVAVCSDGTVPQIPIWQPGSGPKHGLVSGDSGSGKSKAVGVILTQACATRRVVPIIADPQGGASLPAWSGRKAGVAPVIARSPEEITELFAKLSELATHRENLISSLGIGDWDVDTMWKEHGEPVYLVVLDEAHVVLTDPEMVEHAAQAAKVWRKLGMGLLLVSQTPNLTELGGNPALRQNLLGGYVIALRNSGKTAAGMILPSSAPNPNDIPMIIGKQSTQGMCSIAAAAPFGTPTGFARFPFMPNELAHSESLRLARDVMPDPDPKAAELLGIDVDAWRKRLDGIADGSAEVDKAPSALVEQGRATKKAQILEFLQGQDEGRCVAPADIIATLGFKSSTVSQTLTRLKDDGLVESPAEGLWRATTAKETE
jgi:DNA-binding transcriptional ArsR family regulator